MRIDGRFWELFGWSVVVGPAAIATLLLHPPLTFRHARPLPSSSAEAPSATPRSVQAPFDKASPDLTRVVSDVVSYPVAAQAPQLSRSEIRQISIVASASPVPPPDEPAREEPAPGASAPASGAAPTSKRVKPFVLRGSSERMKSTVLVPFWHLKHGHWFYRLARR
jgi:hypothetical protein